MRALASLFGDREFYQKLFAFAVPVMLQNLISSLVNILDTIMIGRLGTAEIAAVGLGNQVFFLYSTLVFGAGSGCGIFAAQFWGKGDIPGIRKTIGLGLSLSLALGLLFTLAAACFPESLIRVFSRDTAVIELGARYLRFLCPSFLPFALACVFTIVLRSIEKIRLSFAASLAAIGINLVLNYVFIFGLGPVPALGVAGAAIATVIARIAETLILVIVSYAKRYGIAGSPGELLSFDRPFVRAFLITVVPIIGNRLIWSLAINIHNVIFARLHTDAVAAFSIINTIAELAWAVFMGLGSGAGVLVGKKIGEGDEGGARDYARRIVIFAPLVSAVMALLFAPLTLTLPLLFKVSPQTLSLAGSMLLIFAASFPARAFNVALVIGVCQAGGDTLFCAIFDLVFMWFFSIPAAVLGAFVFGVPVWAVYALITAEDFMKMFFMGIWRFRSGRWLHNVVKDL